MCDCPHHPLGCYGHPTSCTCATEQFDFGVFERATELMAQWLARFRDETSNPSDNDRLTAGHLAGALAANNLLVTKLPKAST